MSNHLKIVGFYSITADGEYEDSTSSLRYFIKPELPINLNKGIDDLKPKIDTYHERKIDRILTFIVNHKREFLNKKESIQGGDRLIPSTQYITSRSVLRMIFCSRAIKDSWDILATKYKGNIYLCKYMSPEDIKKDNDPYCYGGKYVRYHGPMFEHHCLSEHPREQPNTSEACDENTQFYCVFQRGLVNREFLYGGEMDGTDSETPLDPTKVREWNPNQFIELKVNYELSSQNRIFTFENKKVHKIYAQSFLSGIERVYIGFRDTNGILRQIRCYSTAELEGISKRKWTDSMDGLEFLDFFLNKVEAHLKDTNCPYTTIKYSHNAYTKNLSSTLYKGKTMYTFLPEWYLQEMK